MRVLFLTQYPKIAPSPRYRVYQLVPWLQANGVDCTVEPLLGVEEYKQSRQKGKLFSKAAMLAKAVLRRRRLVARAHEFDLVYILKGAFMYGPPLFERKLRKQDVAMAFDFDDAIYIHKDSTHNGLVDRFKSTERIPETIGMVDSVIVPNQYLADYSRGFNENVTVVAEAEDTDRFIPRDAHEPKSDGKYVIGWIGSPSTVKYMRLIAPALQRVCAEFPNLVLRSVGGTFEAEGVRVENIPWTYEREVENFQALDIGIMPLPLEEWSKGKSGCKLRQYMATGVPGVATRIGYNCELVEHGKNGLLVETQEEWYDALSSLIRNHNLRNQLANNARQSVVERFSLPVIGPQLKKALEEAIALRKKSLTDR